MPKNQLTGKVVSNKMSKTLVVRVERIKEHQKYKRRYMVSKNYKVHNEKGDYKIGDSVLIEECRPLSKDKKWRVIKKLASETEEAISELAVEELNGIRESESVEPKEKENSEEKNK